MQRLADATVWPRLFGNCHTHRHTEQYIADAGFEVARRQARVGDARMGADARIGNRDRAGRQAGLTPRQPNSAGSRCNRLGSAVAAVSRNEIDALSDSGVRSGFTSITGMPLARASSGSPAAG